MALKDWSTTAADNDDADAGINWAEGQAPSTVNGSAREMMAVLKNALGHIVNVKDYGAVADGVTDDTAAFQAAIDHVNGLTNGGQVIVPPGNYVCANVILKSNVRIVGWVGGVGMYGVGFAPRLTMTGSGWILDTAAAQVVNVAVIGISFQGGGSAANDGGIRFQSSERCVVSSCSFNNFANQAILASSCGIDSYIQNFAQNCLLNRTRSAKNGVLEIIGSDCYIYGGEYTASTSTDLGTISDSNLRICAVAIKTGGNNFITNTVCEISDIGLYITASTTKAVGVRCDLNYADGFEIIGTQNMLIGCHGFRNGLGVDATYADFNLTGSALNNVIGCFGQSVTADSNRVAYAFKDSVNTDGFKQYYVGCRGEFYRTAMFSTSDNNGGAVSVEGGPPKAFTDADTTPSVDGYATWRVNNTGATTVTDFDDGVGGQIISLIPQNANTTVSHNANIKTLSGANTVLRSLKFYQFQLWNGVWYELGDTRNQVSADKGDADATLTPGSSEQTAVWNTPLTTGRTATLATGTAWNGAKFRIVRTTAATGASNLSAGGLKNLAVGTWCDVEYNGSAWVLTAYGAL